MTYSAPAYAFRESNPLGRRFYPRLTHAAHAGNTLTVIELLRRYGNPDDDMYLCCTDDGETFTARAYWLRKCCDDVTSER